MAKRKPRKADPHKVSEAAKNVLGHIAGLCSDSSFLTQQETESRIAGIPLPSLGMCYLIKNDVLPFGRHLYLNGFQHSCKSALSLEIMRWFLIYSGIGHLIENETKDIPDMRAGIMQHDQELISRYNVVPTSSMDEWQNVLNRACEHMVELNKQQSYSTPYVAIVDSVTSKDTRAEQLKVLTKGAGRGYSDVARGTTKFFQTFPSFFTLSPLFFIAVQHLKKGTKDIGGGRTVAENHTPGASQIKFQETFEWQLTKLSEVKNTTETVVKIIINTKKNLGPNKQSLEVLFRWWWAEHPQTGEWVQYHMWDWWDATFGLFMDISKNQKTLFTHIQKIMGISFLSGRRVTVKALGITKSSPASFHEAGVLLEQRPDLLLPLYRLLEIKRRRRYSPGDLLSDCWARPVGDTFEPTLYKPATASDAQQALDASIDSAEAQIPQIEEYTEFEEDEADNAD